MVPNCLGTLNKSVDFLARKACFPRDLGCSFVGLVVCLICQSVKKGIECDSCMFVG